MPQVFLLGFKHNPFKYISKCDLFILTSRFEGFPNALVEAGILGIPLLANDCKGGINEIIDKRYGEIYDYNSLIDLQDKINYMMTIKYSNNEIRNNFIKRFDKKNIIMNYHKVLLNI